MYIAAEPLGFTVGAIHGGFVLDPSVTQASQMNQRTVVIFIFLGLNWASLGVANSG